MDNQKSTEGKGSDASREGAGSSIGKGQDSNLGKSSGASGSSLGSGASGGSLGSANASPSSASGASSSSTGAVGGTSNASSGSSGSSLGSSAAGSSGSMGSSASPGSSSLSSGGNSGLGTGGSSTGSNIGSSQSDMGQQQQGGIKGTMASMSPDKMHQGIDKAAQAAQPMVERLVSTAHAGVDRVSGMLSSTKESMGQRSQQLNEKYQDLSAQGREYVRNNPGSAMLAAIGVGFVLAKLLGGSSDRSRDSRSYRDYRDY